MRHRELVRIVHGATDAVLFIHGIAGTPDHFDFLVSMVPKGMSVRNMLLDGHGKGVREFSQTSMKKWEAQVQMAVDDLAKNHDRILIVAHSMGTLFAVEQAVKNPRITKLFLLAAPLKIFLKPSLVAYSAGVFLDKIDPKDPRAVAAKKCCGIDMNKNPFAYLGWIPRYLELLAKIHKTRKHLPQLQTPCVVCQSVLDEMVSIRSEKLFACNANVVCAPLKNSTHYYYTPEDMHQLKQMFRTFLEDSHD